MSLYQGGLAQLARALALQAKGHRFDSDILHENKCGNVMNMGNVEMGFPQFKKFFIILDVGVRPVDSKSKHQQR